MNDETHRSFHKILSEPTSALLRKKNRNGIANNKLKQSSKEMVFISEIQDQNSLDSSTHSQNMSFINELDQQRTHIKTPHLNEDNSSSTHLPLLQSPVATFTKNRQIKMS